MERDLWFLLVEIFFSLLLLLPIDVFCLLIFLTRVFLHCLRLSKNGRTRDDVLPIANCATLLLTRNASFEICNPRRSWHVMTLSETRRGPGHLSPFVVRSEDPDEAMAVLNAWQK